MWHFSSEMNAFYFSITIIHFLFKPLICTEKPFNYVHTTHWLDRHCVIWTRRVREDNSSNVSTLKAFSSHHTIKYINIWVGISNRKLSNYSSYIIMALETTINSIVSVYQAVMKIGTTYAIHDVTVHPSLEICLWSVPVFHEISTDLPMSFGLRS